MAKRREESDGRVLPEDRRKAVPTGGNLRGGKATTASKQAGQRDLFLETADSPQGAAAGMGAGRPASGRSAVPKSRNTPEEHLPAMTDAPSVAPVHLETWDSCGQQCRHRNTGIHFPRPRCPEEPDVRPTSPVL